MDEPDGGCSWQAWKFGMKREDLYTKLQDQYNTVTLSIQDPEAFHNDVREISKVATDLDEFHRLLEQRKQLRLDQLNESLQSASVEIIANPLLIGTDQWEHAIQLFRTRSYDSLVRYFSSYLPEDHQWDTFVQEAAITSYFNNEVDDPSHLMTHEPLPYMSGTAHKIIPASHLPPSPRSLTMCSDSSNISTPSRTLSFSELDTDTDAMLLSTTLTTEFDDETSQYDDPDSPTTPMSEISDVNPMEYPYLTRAHLNKSHEIFHDTQVGTKELFESQSPSWPEDDTKESETPTPTPRKSTADSYIPHEAVTQSASKPTPLPSKYTLLERRIREVSPGSARVRRRSPEIGRIQKPSSDLIRARPIGLKR